MNAEERNLCVFCVQGGEPLEDERRALAARMTAKAAKLLLDMPLRQMRRLEEMRFYAGQNACFVFDGRGETQNVFFSQRDVDELVTALCGHSRYAYETQLAQGYIPLGNGCRAGVCGRVTTGESGRLSSPTSVCIRVARDVPGASSGVLPYIMGEGGWVCRALFLGPPGCGKTTVLRDAAKKLAAMGIRVAVCDEREELFPTGEAEKGIDVMRGVDKAAAVEMLLRAMAPQAILCDEIGNERDAQALENAARCGVGLLASAHAGAWTDVLRRPILKRLYDGATFERYLLLGRHGRLAAAYDAEGTPLFREDGTDVEHGGDGHDFAQRDRFCSGGWRDAARSVDSGDAPLYSADERRHSL